MPSPLTIICPVGDKFGTVKSHELAGYVGWEFPTQAEEDAWVAAYPLIHIEVTHEEWALFALNARSANVPSQLSPLGDHTVWRSSFPQWIPYSLDTEVGREASPTYLNTGGVPRAPRGIMPFRTQPWILAPGGLNQPNPGEGFETPYGTPQCYILDGKFYIAKQSFGQPPERLELNGQTLTHYWTVGGQEYDVISHEITSTFYPTT